ncbi:FAD/NAD(P)-binding domain-containing protein [Macrolepiota fuliginosa MF-IS2]|uniref:FAD/NAD(P)-binding domain-containing protein n=1 Tax=Macrolepiota fuliginosa MF-IS2 TaxID=1400762 RepID=A0A9P5XDR5_9AGAR|nr:FAD/NAD(P)-binding domain-containing protein [Macrolepiota fuliginosa MF-IS2]
MSSQRYPTAPLALHFTVVGCGISGLCVAYALGRAGHRITIIESAPLLTDVGAGIQITPNVSRILIRWGFGDQFDEMGVKPNFAAFRRYKDDEVVGINILGDDIQKRFGSPYWNVHRADLLQVLYDAAKPFIQVIQDRVVSISTSSRGSPFVTTETGLVVHSDVIIGADGIKSVVRSFVTGQKDRPKPTGDLAYRALIPVDALMNDPILRPLVETPHATVWMGPHRHIVGYSVSGMKMYNLVLLCPDIGSEESWSMDADPKEIRATYAGWSPTVTKLVSLIKKGMKSRLVVREPLKSWTHPNGRITLIGDACHPMLPYVAQGAAMAVEDAAVLGALFSRITSHSQISNLLRVYESLRIPRTTNTQLAALSNQGIFHLPDGPEQQARDEAMQKLTHERERSKVSQGGEEVVDDEGDRMKMKILYSYDPDQAVEEWYRPEGHRMYGEKMKL